MIDTLEVEKQFRKMTEAEVKVLVRRTLTPRDWEESPHQACQNGDDQVLSINLVCLMKTGISERNPIQMLIIKNLTSKLEKGNNHHYVDLIKDLSWLFKNDLGLTNYLERVMPSQREKGHFQGRQRLKK